MVTPLILLFVSAALAPSQLINREDNFPTVTVCDILSQPLQYDGKMVRLRSRMGGTDEGSWFIGDECPGIFVTGKYVWPSVIWFATPADPGPNHIRPIDFEFDSESESRIDAKYKALRRRARDFGEAER